LRRTTLRPPTLEYLNRSPSPRRSPSPISRSTNQSPANRSHSSIHRGHSPVKQEIFVQSRDVRNNAITNEFALIEKEQKITENDLVKLINEVVQTGPLKKTHGTQMTPYDSEASDISCTFLFGINSIVTPKKTIKSQTSSKTLAVTKKYIESEMIDDESSLFVNEDYVCFNN
jgi:hypothetical protein